ncbi:acetyl-CoA C-acetyltransferase [Duganella sp. SG902]|uniref:acetyl-CoA C-acetyltransferase n=1 Tax=Duganella sp. SG902 TaxID=2587016 RepID=UPI00159E0862|nr:acetyl-CoA C-acetyltransferase [Duganella sp. SG902]NVM79687.1 acetyl-CoA C-acetyltransferase [Duganella sp. SG902]
MSDAYIYEAIRTPRGKGRQDGSLHSVKPISLLTGLMNELQQRHQLDTALIDDVLIGCVTPIGEQGADIAKIAALSAGWDWRVAGAQLNRFCASGLEAVNLAAQKVRSGWEELVVAGGVESMSRVPMGSDGGAWTQDPETSLKTGYVPQGIGADLIATLDGYQREQLDAYALRSQQRAAAARAAGRFRSIVPVRDQNGVLILAEDEFIKPATTMEALASLKPAFAAMGEQGFDAIALRKYAPLRRIEHLHTAGNSSGIVDGAALALIGSKAAGARLGLAPRARILAAAVTGSEPTIMLTGPAPAARKALQKAGLSVNDIDLFEVNEAFASVVLRFLRELEVPDDKVNVNGGGIALGHPLGATGCMLLGTLLDELEARRLRRGMVTLCVGGGMGIATIIERL